MLTGEMSRHTTFKFCLDPAVEQRDVLARHAGASRFAKILFATVTYHGERWWVSLNIEAADLHPAHQHLRRAEGDSGGWVGVDRGLSALAVAATTEGVEVARVTDAPKALATGIKRQQRLAKSLSRKKKGSTNRQDTARKLRRHHPHVANVRRHFLHQVSGALVKTHERLVIEDLHVSGMLANHRLAQAISDAGWAELARMLGYKQAWRAGQVAVADRWYPSSKLCAGCGAINTGLTLADRAFSCDCGYHADRDANAATNLARWGQTHHNTQHDLSRSPDPQARGRATNVRRRDGSDLGAPPACGGHPARSGETSPKDAGTDVHTAPAA
jgi:putative transposase